MNVVFLSPHFPPQFYLFCAALKEQGARVLGIGDTPANELRPELSRALTEYVYLPRLDDYDALLRTAGYLTWKHGRIDRVDSLNEHWLGVEARLREDFNVPGPREAQTARLRSKASMAAIFREAGVPAPEAVRVDLPEQLRSFARRHGLPLVLKPDLGVGAARTWKVSTHAELDAALDGPLQGYVAQPYVQGAITTFDGLLDAGGRVVFSTSFVYGAGVMETLTEKRDLYYYSRRQIPEALEELGRRSIAAFGLKERFFHAEFFELPGGGFEALEVNIRPPGGFSTDMMNYACDVDVYGLWARVLTGADLSEFRFERKYHCAHASRRKGVTYRLGHEDLVARLGAALVLHREIPPVFAGAMGDHAYLLRHEEETALLEAIALVQERAG